jgi:hypothetical protein
LGANGTAMMVTAARAKEPMIAGLRPMVSMNRAAGASARV